MKSFLIIGMGKFGHHLCEALLNYSHDIMIVDSSEERVTDLVNKVENVLIGDCTDPKVIKSLGVENFDVVFICIGANFQNSLEVTWLVNEAGAKWIVSKANKDMHARFLLRNGADEVIYPDRDVASQTARTYSADGIEDYIEIEDGFSMCEMLVRPEWVGQSLRSMNLRTRYKLNVIGLRTADKKINIIPDPDYLFTAEDYLLVVGKDKDVEKILNIKTEEKKEDKFWKQLGNRKKD